MISLYQVLSVLIYAVEYDWIRATLKMILGNETLWKQWKKSVMRLAGVVMMATGFYGLYKFRALVDYYRDLDEDKDKDQDKENVEKLRKDNRSNKKDNNCEIELEDTNTDRNSRKIEFD
eukprot:CAMPEP_0116941500 /NCGR_PEP_ID=MMETSP0467-20121206/34024_1 /TAXON_ID=283647 /ORGANISM="Mesodinium pulex, Strain SPMC105" /LENGTH=118 /DNA_ID=CAMNT_0004624293 /DNA_START=245 /DNA_END=598 /DNA_ORIENTATION=-